LIGRSPASCRRDSTATVLGLPVADVVTEIGSGLNGRRRTLHRVLSDPAASVLVVEHRDRLASDLVRDSTEVLTSMCARLCARLYGQRVAKNRTARAVAVAMGQVSGRVSG
jgi:putative resolvase